MELSQVKCEDLGCLSGDGQRLFSGTLTLQHSPPWGFQHTPTFGESLQAASQSLVLTHRKHRNSKCWVDMGHTPIASAVFLVINHVENLVKVMDPLTRKNNEYMFVPGFAFDFLGFISSTWSAKRCSLSLRIYRKILPCLSLLESEHGGIGREEDRELSILGSLLEENTVRSRLWACS